MVNAQKHRELLNDYETRFKKKIVRQQLISKNSQKVEREGNKLLYNRGGTAGRNSIVETNKKREQADKDFIQLTENYFKLRGIRRVI